MDRWARIDGAHVVEIILLPEGSNPATVFAPDVLASLRAAPAEVEAGWTANEDGSFSAPPASPPVDLAALKAVLKQSVDMAAEIERAKYITPGAGQAMTYQQKASEAVMLEDDPAPDAADYPLLAAEVGITAPTLAEVGAVVRQAHGMWILLGAGIEAARLGAKKAIDEAETPEAAATAGVVTWPAAE